MTDNKVVCGFCGIPKAPHEGGMTFDGKEYKDVFCGETCFKNWVNWKVTLMTAKITVQNEV